MDSTRVITENAFVAAKNEKREGLKFVACEEIMSKSTISTFELFQMFPDQETARNSLYTLPQAPG